MKQRKRMRYYHYHHHPQTKVWQRLLQPLCLRRNDHGTTIVQYRHFVTNIGNNNNNKNTSTVASGPSHEFYSIMMRIDRNHMFNLIHPHLHDRIRPTTVSWFSSSSSSGFDTSSSDPVIPSSSSFYDPRTNEPAGLRVVVEGMKRMEQQITNIENDIEAIKNVVKKIRESNGRTEERLNTIEDFADTMQQDLYLAMDMVRTLSDAIVPKDHPQYLIPTNQNIAAAKEAAAAAKARSIRQQYHSKNHSTAASDTDHTSGSNSS